MLTGQYDHVGLVMEDVVYRYAAFDTVINMLESQELWFSDIKKMNDWDEYDCGYRIVEKVVLAEYPDKFHILKKISPSKINSDFSILICSFSQKFDCLSMWRGYGDNGNGAAIGYSMRDIENQSLIQRYLAKNAPVNGKILFFPVIYSVDIFINEVKRYLNESRWQNPGVELNDTQFNHLKDGKLCMALIRLCTLYKNDFFVDERETRGFIEIDSFTDPYELTEREVYSEQSKYHKFCTAFKNIPAIKEVVLGPMCKISEGKLREKLTSLGLGSVAIRKSRGTYR